MKTRESESRAKSQFILWSKKLGFNISKLTDEEQRVFMKVLEDSSLHKKQLKENKTIANIW